MFIFPLWYGKGLHSIGASLVTKDIKQEKMIGAENIL